MENNLDFISDEWIVEATIDDLQRALEFGKTTSKQIVMTYLKRIALYDKSGKKFNSILEINPDALYIAESLDLERKEKGSRGPLHGIPVVIKDNIDTFDKMCTSAGSLALKNSFATKDAFIVNKLRNAGAVILGKANLTEFANFMTTNMENGYSSRGGQVLNPYGPGKFDVGGSSSGSAVSVSCNLCTVSIGTETSGSILSPSNQNSVVGIKPTVGLLSRSGIIPISHTQDTAGPIARTVKDAATLLNWLIDKDINDPATSRIPNSFKLDFTQILNEDGLNGARIGIPREKYYDYLDDEKIILMKNAINILKKKGAIIIDPVEIPTPKFDLDYKVLLYEFKRGINSYLNSLNTNSPVKSLRDIIEFNNSYPEATLKYGQTILIESESTSGTLTESEYLESLAKDQYYSKELGIDYVMKKHNLNALLFPSYYGSAISAKAGYPSIIVPSGYTSDGEPFGITFTGTAFSDPTLIKLAYSYEFSTKHRTPPKLNI